LLPYACLYVCLHPCADYWCENTTLTTAMDGKPQAAMCSDPTAANWGKCGTDVQCFTAGVTASTADSADSRHKRAIAGADARRSEVVASAAPKEVWVLVDVKAKSATEVTLDLSKLNGAAPLALRYAWDNEKDSCCQSEGPTSWCEPAACPIW
jgi:hypothetical protein